MIAANDGKVVKIGQNKQLGRYVMLQDATGNVYTYANLGSIPSKYPVPKRVKVTGGGKLRREMTGRRHILEKKSSTLTRRLEGTT